jgi:hypothetical protein
VLLAVDNIPTHLWSREFVQEVIGSACLIFEPAPATTSREDMSRFFIVAWATHPDLIPNDVGCIVPELEELLVVLPPLFIGEEEIIHSNQDVNLSLTRSIDRCMFSFLISQGSCACTRARAPGCERRARQGTSQAFLVATESWPRFKRWT